MSVLEYLETQFTSMGVTIKNTVLQKCAELCSTYVMQAEDFIDEWFAFSASKLNGADPSLDALDQMERKVLKKLASSTSHVHQNYPVSANTTPVRTPVRQKEHVEEIPMIIQETPSTSSAPSDFAKRVNAGLVVEKFGKCDTDTFKQRCQSALVIKLENKVTNGQYMYEKFLSKQAALNEMYRCVIGDILEHTKLELTHERLKQYSGEMVICGRIFSDTLGKIGENSIQLEGFADLYRGQKIKLSTKRLQKYALFSGQCAVLSGNNMMDWFTVEKIHTGAPLPPPENPIQLSETLQIMVAAGPFTLSGNLLYEPLDSLLQSVTEYKPNVLILMGPFLESSHSHIGDMTECYDTFFENLIDGIMKRLVGSGTQVVVVPSHKDIHNHIVFPSLPFKLKRRYDGLHLVPNPFLLNINGFVIGGSTADILFHLCKVECSSGVHGKRINRLISHIFNQRSFYPLYPPDSDIKIDYQLLEQLGIIFNSPHLMLLPSSLKCFMEIVENCVVINPERLTKGNNAGTFARIEVRTSTMGEKIPERVSCQIFRI